MSHDIGLEKLSGKRHLKAEETASARLEARARGLTVGMELQWIAEVPLARTIRRAEEWVFEEGDVGVDWAD